MIGKGEALVREETDFGAGRNSFLHQQLALLKVV